MHVRSHTYVSIRDPGAALAWRAVMGATEEWWRKLVESSVKFIKVCTFAGIYVPCLAMTPAC